MHRGRETGSEGVSLPGHLHDHGLAQRLAQLDSYLGPGEEVALDEIAHNLRRLLVEPRDHERGVQRGLGQRARGITGAGIDGVAVGTILRVAEGACDACHNVGREGVLQATGLFVRRRQRH